MKYRLELRRASHYSTLKTIMSQFYNFVFVQIHFKSSNKTNKYKMANLACLKFEQFQVEPNINQIKILTIFSRPLNFSPDFLNFRS